MGIFFFFFSFWDGNSVIPLSCIFCSLRIIDTQSGNGFCPELNKHRPFARPQWHTTFLRSCLEEFGNTCRTWEELVSVRTTDILLAVRIRRGC